MPGVAGNPALLLIVVGIATCIFITYTAFDKMLFVQANKLFKHIKFEKTQSVVDSYLYSK